MAQDFVGRDVGARGFGKGSGRARGTQGGGSTDNANRVTSTRSDNATSTSTDRKHRRRSQEGECRFTSKCAICFVAAAAADASLNHARPHKREFKAVGVTESSILILA